MTTTIAIQMTAQGLLIPYAAIREWAKQGLEVIKEPQRIIVQPKPTPRTERERVIQILEDTGLLVKSRWEPTTPPVSNTELAELAQKFSVGKPLSEIVLEEREARW